MRTCLAVFFTTCFLQIYAWSEISTAKTRKRDLRSRGSVVYAENENCPYPCTCPLIGQEICRECEECPRQLGEPCSEDHPCDRQRGLICRYKHGDNEGVCRESTGVPCIVHNKTYDHGETFTLDCRTQCACQNGTYGCSSLCPQEHISPRGSCQHPRLVDVPNQCCREWMCDSPTVEQPSSCQPIFSRWSACSSECGVGLSSRHSNLNARCQSDLETRICQIRRCNNDVNQDGDSSLMHFNRKKERKPQHHLRRGHECKATHRLSTGVYLAFGPCQSRKRFRPKFCGSCTLPNVQCRPTLSTTVKVDFKCNGPLPNEKISELLPEYLEPTADLWTDGFEWAKPSRENHIADDANDEEELSTTLSRLMTVSVQWVLKCRCESVVDEKNTNVVDDGVVKTNEPTSSTGEVILHRVHRTAAP